jgi:hypothetical protein
MAIMARLLGVVSPCTLHPGVARRPFLELALPGAICRTVADSPTISFTALTIDRSSPSPSQNDKAA